jgi:hypothetical protein
MKILKKIFKLKKKQEQLSSSQNDPPFFDLHASLVPTTTVQPINKTTSRNATIPSEDIASQPESGPALEYYAPIQEYHVPSDLNREAFEERRESTINSVVYYFNKITPSRINRAEQLEKNGDGAFDNQKYEEALTLYTKAIGTSIQYSLHSSTMLEINQRTQLRPL